MYNIYGNPSTLQEAIDLASGLQTKKCLEDLKRTKENDALLHHGLGRCLRNEWKLWEPDSVLPKYFKNKLGIIHADDMSGLIIKGMLAKIRNEKFDIDVEVEEYKEHWKDEPVSEHDIKS